MTPRPDSGIGLFLMALLLPLCACNSDIFVEAIPPLPQSITLDGNGGSASFLINRKNIVGLELSNDIDYQTEILFLDSSGEPADPADIDRLAKVRYFAPGSCIDFDVDGDRATVSALDNTYDCDITIWLMLDYGFTTVGMDITVTPGEPMSISALSFDLDNAYASTRTVESSPRRYINNSSETKYVVRFPYRDVLSSIYIEDRLWNSSSWIHGIADLPCYAGGAWSTAISNPAEIDIGSLTYYTSANAPVDQSVTFEIPPGASLALTQRITYATLSVACPCVVTQPHSRLSWTIDAFATIRQPIEIIIEPYNE